MKGPQSEPLLHINSPRNGRRAASLSLALSANGLAHRVYVPLWKFLKRNVLGDLAFDSPKCSRTYWLGPTELLLTDNIKEARARELRREKTIYVSFTTGARFDYQFANRAFLPILFHPTLLNEDAYRHASSLRANKARPITLLFVGNSSEGSYGEPLPNGLMNRYEILKSVRGHAVPTWIFPATYSDLRASIDSGLTKKRPVWVDTKHFKIPSEEWLGLLSESSYFLAAPGVTYPYCHNLNEAMACGAVPVLQHEMLYDPPLVNGENCITFSNDATLSAAVASLFHVESDTWSKQSVNAHEYHDEYLSYKRLGRLIECFKALKEVAVLELKMAGRITQ